VKRIESKLNTASADFQANAEHNRRLAEAFKEKQDKVRHARPQRDIDRLRQQKKLLVRERLELLLDPGTPFMSCPRWPPTSPTTARCRARPA
jgi:3-methylcrotonyl-CoA carboxylase beta subunit